MIFGQNRINYPVRKWRIGNHALTTGGRSGGMLKERKIKHRFAGGRYNEWMLKTYVTLTVNSGDSCAIWDNKKHFSEG